MNFHILDPEAGPTELQNKVQFDIHYYFARRGREHIYEMTKNTLKWCKMQILGSLMLPEPRMRKQKIEKKLILT